MGNCFRRCLEDDSDTDYFAAGGGHYPGYSHGQSTQAGGGGPAYPRPGGSFTYNVVGFTAVARDLLEFETTSKVCPFFIISPAIDVDGGASSLVDGGGEC